MSEVPHIPYYSLEQFRNALVNKYLDIYTEDVVVQEKIHGSNIVIYGEYKDNIWNFKLGSRRRWITSEDKFNNFQQVFEENKENITNMFTYLLEKNNITKGQIRIYGEIFGGKYGQESSPNSIKTQTEPNYGPNNDFAFFDIFINHQEANLLEEPIINNKVPILEAMEIFEKFNLKVAPVIFNGKLSEFLADFDVNKFQSVVSSVFYNLPYIHSNKGTEGVTIRSVNPQSNDEKIVLKYKQTWAVENRRVINPRPTIINQNSEVERLCLNMMNNNRIQSYASKNTIDDLTNPRLIGSHIKEIVNDTMKDIRDEFQSDKFPDLNLKKMSGLLSKKGFPLFKNYLKTLENASLTTEQRIERLINEQTKLIANVNTLSVRVESLKTRLRTLQQL